VIAIGDIATGFLAIGGLARGAIALGGLAVGLVAFGGLGVGVLAFGGLALGYFAAGGAAIGFAAAGGLAIGYYAAGGAAIGKFVLGPLHRDPEAVEFFSRLVHGLLSLPERSDGVSAKKSAKRQAKPCLRLLRLAQGTLRSMVGLRRACVQDGS
jgi:hypothetical protein